VLDFNRLQLSEEPISVAINALIEQAEPPEKNAREYLGASAIGDECLRRVQYDWMCTPVQLSQTRDIFARGHFFEELSRQHLICVGFNFAPALTPNFVVDAKAPSNSCSVVALRTWTEIPPALAVLAASLT
jgi:hypothetical protein